MNLKPYYRLPARGGTPTWVKVADSQNRNGLVDYKEHIYMSPKEKTGKTQFSKYNKRTGTHAYFGPTSHSGHFSLYTQNIKGTLLNGFLYWGPKGHSLPNGTVNKLFKVDPQTDTLTREGGYPDNFSINYFSVYNNQYLYSPNSSNSHSSKFCKHDTQTGTTTMFGSKAKGVAGSRAHCFGKDGKLYTVNFGGGDNTLIEFDCSTDTYTVESYPGIKKGNSTWNIGSMVLANDGFLYLISTADNKLTKIDTDTRTVTKLPVPHTHVGDLEYGKRSQQIGVGAQIGNKSFLFSPVSENTQEIEPSTSKKSSITEDNTGTFYCLFDDDTLHKLEYQ